MAVPSNVTAKDTSGTYVLNKTLSDSSQELLKMQNVGWLVRQAIAYSTITVTIKDFVDDEGKRHLEQHQVSLGGITNDDNRVLDGEWRENENKIWGKVKGSNR
jgi:hypothetical protein